MVVNDGKDHFCIPMVTILTTMIINATRHFNEIVRDTYYLRIIGWYLLLIIWLQNCLLLLNYRVLRE